MTFDKNSLRHPVVQAEYEGERQKSVSFIAIFCDVGDQGKSVSHHNHSSSFDSSFFLRGYEYSGKLCH